MNVSQLSSSLLSTLLGTNTTNTPDVSQSILNPVSQPNLLSQGIGTKSTVAQLSPTGKALNDLYASVKKTGNEAALTGFRQYVTGLVSGAENSTLQSFVKMGQEAFQKKGSNSFVSMLGDYKKLAGSGYVTTGKALLNEAVATYNDEGMNAAKTYVATANNILNATKSEKNNVAVTGADVLSQFTSLWKQIRTQTNVDQNKIVAQENELSKGISGKTDALDIRNYIKTEQSKLT